MRRTARNILFIIAVFLSVAHTATWGKVIHVDDDGVADFATIQESIDVASDGDTVLVAPGTYTGEGNRDIDFKGKAITVRSEAGPRTCVIACQGSESEPHRGFYFHSGEAGDSVLDGFTVTGGYADGGGGIACYQNSSPSIRNCIIEGNVAHRGGGIYLSKSEVVVSNCVIAGNWARPRTAGIPGHGGGLACGKGHPTVRKCTIYGNRSEGTGGGVQCGPGRGTALFVNCILTGNESLESAQLFSGGCASILGCPDIEIVNCCIEDDPNAIFVENWSDPRKVPDNCIRDDPVFAQPGYWDPNDRSDYPYDDFWVDGD